jgi:hypothetical protein
MAPLVFIAFMGLTSPALAQSAIGGLVTDSTGAVLPGVAVEASSPALIEQTRSVITDANGRYLIVDLRPGTYSVTFALQGFSTFVREGVALESEFTATVNAQMRVGALEETITVAGGTPVVDVQSTTSRSVLTAEQVEALPSGRSFQTLAATIPGLAPSGSGRFDVGGSSQMWQGTVAAYGSQGGDMALEVDGMSVQSLLSTGSIAGAGHNQDAYQEMSFQVVAGSAESQTGGVRINMIPKEGGNRFAGSAIAMYSNEGFVSANIDDKLRASGLDIAPSLRRTYDYNASLGGPLKRDRAWFFFSPRSWGVSNYITNQRFPDGTPAFDYTDLDAYTTRITLQVNAKNKLTGMYDLLPRYRQYFMSETGTRTLKGSGIQDQFTGVVQAKWTSTVTSRLLIEAGFSRHFVGYNIAYQDDVQRPSSANPFGDVSKSDTAISALTVYNAVVNEFYNPFVARNLVGSATYVTGTHNFKVGVQNKFGWIKNTVTQNGDMVQVYNNGRPLQVRAYNTPINSRSNLNGDLGLYVQDSWKIDRLTLNPGLRFERFNAAVAEQSALAGRFVPARHFDAIPNLPNYTNWVPRFGAAYDLFGTGKTGLKGSVGRYMEQDATSFPQRYNPMVQSTTNLAWTDLNGDDLAQGEIGCTYLTSGCEINFSQLPRTFGARRNRNPDPNIERPYQIVYNIGITHEVAPGVGVALNYYRRDFRNITFTTDLAKPPSVYTPFSIPDPRGNGQMLTVYAIDPAALATINELDTNSHNNKRAFNGFDITLTRRLPNGGFFSGGTSTGRTISTECDVTNPNQSRFCDERGFDVPFRTTLKMSGNYPLPYGFRVSGVFQSIAGDASNYTYVVTAASFASVTGANLGQPSVTMRLTEPGSNYLERVNQLDVTFARSFNANRVRVSPEVSLFNAFNANPVLSESTAYPRVGTPLSVLDGRLIRFSIQMRF